MDQQKSHREANYRNFKLNEDWVIKQDIYYNQVLDQTMDHYPVDHPENEGKYSANFLFVVSTIKREDWLTH